MKVQEVKDKLKAMTVGEPLRFSTLQPDEIIEVERIFVGLEEAWMIWHRGERMIHRNLDEAAHYIAKHWHLNLKRVIHFQFSELDEIIDLGEF
jgi:hypothetical protein